MRRLPIILYFAFLILAITPAMSQDDTKWVTGTKAEIAKQISDLMEFKNTSTQWDLGNWISGSPRNIVQQYGPGPIFANGDASYVFVKSETQIQYHSYCAQFQTAKSFKEENVAMVRGMSGTVCIEGDLYALSVNDVTEFPTKR
jgi:hypothetical protein